MATTKKRTRRLEVASSNTDVKTDIGKKWAARLRVSQAYYKANSADWNALAKLYSSIYQTQRRWGASISMAWSVVQNLINATFLQAPEPAIRSRRQNGDESKDRNWRDLFRTLHRVTDIATTMEHGIVLSAIEGYAVCWSYFVQKDKTVLEHVKDDAGAIVEQKEHQVAVDQRVCNELVYAHDLRHDPDGRAWDFSDHKWLARIYTRSLQYFIDQFEQYEEESGFTAEGIQRLRQWVSGQRALRRPDQASNAWNEKEGHKEEDPAYLNVSCWEIWSRVEHKIIHVPVGAEFHIGVKDWDEEWIEADTFPATMIAYNWRPADEEGKVGFYPIPLLRLVQSHLENLNRLEALFMESATFDVKKYISISGIFDTTAKTNIQSDANREIIEIDISKLKKTFPSLASDPGALDIRKLFQLLPSSEQSADSQRFLNAINHELNMIYQVTGQGAADRGGVTPGETATATLAMTQALSRRTDRMAEVSASIVDKIDEKNWTLLKQNQTLPLAYQMSNSGDESVWSEMLAEDLWDMDLVFDHHNGSTRPPNKEVVKAERKEIMTLALPVLQAMQMNDAVLWVMKWVLAAYDESGPEGLFNPKVPELAKQVASIIQAVKDGTISPDQATTKLLDSASALADASLSPAAIQEIAQQSVAAAGSTAPGADMTQGTGSLEKPRSVGANAYSKLAGAAGAGAMGGMQSQGGM